MDQYIAKVEEMLKAQAAQAQANQSTQLGQLYKAHPMDRKRSSPEVIATLQSLQLARSEGVRARLNHPKCDAEECKKAQDPRVNLEYWFPLGIFWSQIVRLRVGYQPNVGPQMSLSTLRRIPDSAQCVNFALNGNIDGLKDLFIRGLASPRDVSSTRGYSILRWALYGKQYDTCKFLVNAGADPDYRPISKYDNSPKHKAFDFILQGGLSQEVVETLSCLTEGSDFIDDQSYTQTHRIVLGLSMMSLEEEIIQYPENIDAVDALGRTPLIWAAARGNKRFVALLLGAGAAPNALDVQWTSAVSYAAERDHTVCVRLLLEAGAEPDPVLPSGIRVGSALNCATRNATKLIVLKSLLDFGADVEASGVEGVTSLIHSARTNNASFAMLLLEYGADINATSTLGQTPLTTAIAYNSHDVLQLLLDRWFEYSVCPRLKGPHLLQIAALYADIKTIEILTATNHFMLNFDRSYATGDLTTQLRQRPDATEKLVIAFEDLIGIMKKEPNLREGTGSLMESGLLSCGNPNFERTGSNEGSDDDDLGQSFDDAPEKL